MSGSQTIRDVVIKVSVESGNVDLGPLNSKIQSQLESIAGSYRHGGGSGVQGRSPGNWRGPGTSSAAQLILRDGGVENDLRDRMASEGYTKPYVSDQDRYRDAKQGIASWSRIKRQKTAEEKKEANEEFKSTKMDECIDADMKKKSTSKHASEQREAARKKRAAQRAERARAQHNSATHSARIQTAKGITQLAASTGGASHEMMQAIEATQGIANIAKSATAAFGPYGVAIAAAAAGAMGYTAAMRQARDAAKQLAEVQYQIASIQSAHASSQVGIQASMGIQNIQKTPDRSQWQKILPFIRQRTSMEENITKAQSGLGDNWERRDVVRRRAEEKQSMSERKQANEAKLAHLQRQLSDNASLRSNTEANLEAARDQHRTRSKALLKKKILVGEQRYATQMDVNQGEAAQQGHFWSTMGSYVGLGKAASKLGDSIVDASGGTSDKSFKQQTAAIGVEQKRADAEVASAELQAKRALEEIDQQRLSINQQIATVQANQVNVTQSQVDAARKLAEETRKTVTTQQQTLGAMDPGRRFIAEELAAKYKRREKQKAAGVPVEEWSIWDRQEGRDLGGAVGRSISEANKKSGASSEHADVLTDIDMLKEDETDFQEKQKARKEQGGQQEKELGKTVENQDAIADKIVEGMNDAFDLQKLADKLHEGFEIQKKKMDDLLIQLNYWF